MFAATKVIVMTLTIWLNNGDVTARALISNGDKNTVQECQKDASAIIANMTGAEIEIAGKKIKIEYATANCHLEVRGNNV